MKGKRRWRTSKETSGKACECTVTSGVLKEDGVAVRKEREKNHETYSICPRHGIDRESFRHDDVQHDCRGEQARTRRYDHIRPLLRGSPSVTEDVTIMSQEGFQLSSDAAQPSIAYHRSLELNLFFFSPSS